MNSKANLYEIEKEHIVYSLTYNIFSAKNKDFPKIFSFPLNFVHLIISPILLATGVYSVFSTFYSGYPMMI
jgi:hypothetical protein